MGYVVLFKDINIEAKRIKVIKDWPEPRLVCDIQVFFNFANFYWQFIESFNKIAASLTLILKITRLVNMPLSKRNISNNMIVRFCDNDEKLAKKLRKLKILFKTQKLAKLGKK